MGYNACGNYYGQVNCIDRQIAELEAKKAAILSGACFTACCYAKTYLDPYGLDDELLNEEGKNEKTRMTLMNGAGNTLELEGTEKRVEAFEAERKERNDALFPSCMSFIETVSLALEHGLSVKKVTTRK